MAEVLLCHFRHVRDAQRRGDFLQVSYLHFKCDANTQENSRKGNAEHLLDEILQGTNKWGFLKFQACFCRSSNKAITQKHSQEKKILPNGKK